MSFQLLTLTLVFAVNSFVVGVAKQSSNPIGNQLADLPAGTTEFLPSPFTGETYFQFTPEFRQTTSSLGPKRTNRRGNEKQFAIKVNTLHVDFETADKIMKSAGIENLQMSGGELNPTTKPAGNLETEKRNFVNANSAYLFSPPVVYGQFCEDKLSEIIGFTTGNTKNNATQSPTLSVLENETGTILRGVVRPFLVSASREEGDFSFGLQKKVQLIEEGIIYTSESTTMMMEPNYMQK